MSDDRMKATRPWLKPSPVHQENLDMLNMDVEINREVSGRITDSLIRRKI